MRNITVAVDEETHRRARIRAAELDTSVSALVREFLRRIAPRHQRHERAEGQPLESALERRRRLFDEVFADFDARPSPHAPRSSDFGAMSEQQLGMALVRSFSRNDPGGYLNFEAVLHHRTPTRKEIDFVGPGFGGIAIESKYVDGERWRRATRTMRAGELLAKRWSPHRGH